MPDPFSILALKHPTGSAREPEAQPDLIQAFREWLQPEEGTAYGTLLPLARDEGGVRPAMPDVMRHWLGGVADLMEQSRTAETPSDVTPRAAMAGIVPMAGTAAMAAPRGSLGVFGGQMARQAPLTSKEYINRELQLPPEATALDLAQAATKRGYSKEHIWQATGWQQFKDGMWRFEIDDSVANLRLKTALVPDGNGYKDVVLDLSTVPKAGSKHTVADILDHPELFKQYPGLRNIEIEVVAASEPFGGLYIPALTQRSPEGVIRTLHPETIGLNLHGMSKRDVEFTLFHELQHAVQHREGFSMGGAPNIQILMHTANNLIKFQSKRNPQLADELEEALAKFVKLSPKKQAEEARRVYDSLLGEVEANVTGVVVPWNRAERMRESPLARMKRLGVPSEDQIVRFRNAMTAALVGGLLGLSPQEAEASLATYHPSIDEALEEGYTLPEIADFLGAAKGVHVEEARQEGYTDEEIVKWLQPSVLPASAFERPPTVEEQIRAEHPDDKIVSIKKIR